MISKELLSEVLGKEVSYFAVRQNEVIFTSDDCDEEINTYELAHKCKEWAYKQGYMVFSGFDDEDQVWKILDTDFTSHCEQEAIFKACQWILENK